MRLKGLLLLLLCIFCDYSSFAQIQGELTQSRILILLDESSSMIQPWAGGKQKYKAADELIIRLMDSIYAVNSGVEFSLRVFGHQHTVAEDNCYDTKNEVAFSKDNRTQMAFRLADIHPLGVTPIAYSLTMAAEQDLVDVQHNAYSIILITDGGESCGGDICDVMQKLLKSKVYFKPYIVSLENDPALKVTYSCMGDYLQVTKDDDIPKAVGTIVEAFRPIIKITKAEYKQMQAIVANAPSILKVNIPTINTPPPADTAATPLKTFKDTTVTPPAAPKPEHKIKVEDAPPPKPKAEQVDRVSLYPLHLLFIAKTTAANIDAVKTTPALPQIVIEQPPVVIPAPQKITRLTPAALKNFTIYAIYNSPVMNLKPVEPGKLPALIIETPKPVVEERKLPQSEKIPYIAPARQKKLNTDFAETRHIKALKTPAMPALVFDKPVPPPAPVPAPKPKPVPAPLPVAPPKPAAEKIARLKPAKLVPANVVFVIEERAYTLLRVPPLPPLKIEVPKLPVSKTAPTVFTQPPGKKMDYKIEAEDAKETTLEVYFTNGKGKFYTTTPQIVLQDPVTHAAIKQFTRFVGPDGSPDPQKDIPVGTYNLTFPAKKNLVIGNVHVEKNKKNKITIRIDNVSLSFVYAGAPDRPVSEFMAQVIERNVPNGRVQNQKCTTTLQYEPGNYHIKINTFPEDTRNVDLDLDAETVITIPQPGFVKFTSDTKRVVNLFVRDGDKFLSFFSLDLSNPISQHLRIQPGEYQAHYQYGPGQGHAAEKVKSFIIKATEETEVILN